MPVVRVDGACESSARIEAARPGALDGCGRRVGGKKNNTEKAYAEKVKAFIKDPQR